MTFAVMEKREPMSKAVMISIRPRWCELIAAGEKTMEVRKTRPKLETPFKVYVYCSKPRFEHEDFFALVGKQGFHGGGKVIGEFVCDGIVWLARVGFTRRGAEPEYRMENNGDWTPIGRLLEEACLTEEEINAYLGGNPGFGWHISDLKIYEKPVDITNFRNCNGCEYMGDCDTYCWKPMQRPPQSWCYVEEHIQ